MGNERTNRHTLAHSLAQTLAYTHPPHKHTHTQIEGYILVPGTFWDE